MRRKGEGGTFGILAAAVLALVVLAVVLFIFRDQIGGVSPFFKTQTTCAGQSGDCVDKAAPCVGNKVRGLQDCTPPKGEFCCIPEMNG